MGMRFSFAKFAERLRIWRGSDFDFHLFSCGPVDADSISPPFFRERKGFSALLSSLLAPARSRRERAGEVPPKENEARGSRNGVKWARSLPPSLPQRTGGQFFQ